MANLPPNSNLPSTIDLIGYYPNISGFNELLSSRVETITGLDASVYTEIVSNNGSGYVNRKSWMGTPPEIGGALNDNYDQFLTSYSMEPLGDFDPTSVNGSIPANILIKCQFYDPVSKLTMVPNTFNVSNPQWQISVRVSEKEILVGSGNKWLYPLPSGTPYNKSYAQYALNLGIAEISLKGLISESYAPQYANFSLMKATEGTMNSVAININNFYFPADTLFYQDFHTEMYINYSAGSPNLVYDITHVMQCNLISGESGQGWTQYWRADKSGGANWDTLLSSGTNGYLIEETDFTTIGIGEAPYNWTLTNVGFQPLGYNSPVTYIDGWNEYYTGRVESFSAKAATIHSTVIGPWGQRQVFMANNFGHYHSGAVALFSGSPGMYLHKITWKPSLGDWQPYSEDNTSVLDSGPRTAIGEAEYIDSMQACTAIPNFGWRLSQFSTGKEILIYGGAYWKSDSGVYNGEGGTNLTIPFSETEVHQAGCYALMFSGGSGSGTLNLNGIISSVGCVNDTAMNLGFIPAYGSTYWGHGSGKTYPSGTLLYMGCNLSQCWCDPLNTFAYPVEHIYMENVDGWQYIWRDDKPGGAGFDILVRSDGSPLIPQADLNTNLNISYGAISYT